nr:hypothetical protein [uncultured Rhodopila sp.]
MTEQWKYQIRVYLDDEAAEIARTDPASPALHPLADILARHDATLKSQFDAFAEYVAEAEQNGVEHYPLYKWTKLTIEDPAKQAQHSKSFALRAGGDEVYPATTADALEAALQPLVGGGLVTRLSRHDTNPANTIPIPEHLR